MRWHRPALLAVSVSVVAACSGGNDESTASTVVEPATTAPTAEADLAPSDGASVTETPAARPDEAGERVGVTASASGWNGSDVTVDVEVPTDGATGPFEEFAACSGLRDHVGAYSVLVSGDSGAVNVWTADRVTAAGIYDAEVRVEPATGAPLVASGTLTVLDGLQAGDFLAFGAGGGRIEGSFECVGGPPPSPLAIGNPADGELDSVEVFVLVRDGDAERVVGLAVDGAGRAECPAVVGNDATPLVVRADGDDRLGSITTFELSSRPDTARLRVGAATYEFTDVSLTLEPDGAAGFFTAAAPDGTSVDGAFRCT